MEKGRRVCRDNLRPSEPRPGRGVGEEGFLFLEYKRSRIQEASGVEEGRWHSPGSTRLEARGLGGFLLSAQRIVRSAAGIDYSEFKARTI